MAKRQGMLGSWSTDRAGGFRESEIAALLRIQKRLAVACKTAVQSSLARNMLETYLGVDAGHRVLSGPDPALVTVKQHAPPLS